MAKASISVIARFLAFGVIEVKDLPKFLTCFRRLILQARPTVDFPLDGPEPLGGQDVIAIQYLATNFGQTRALWWCQFQVFDPGGTAATKAACAPLCGRRWLAYIVSKNRTKTPVT